jgi:hypothetical protein
VCLALLLLLPALLTRCRPLIPIEAEAVPLEAEPEASPALDALLPAASDSMAPANPSVVRGTMGSDIAAARGGDAEKGREKMEAKRRRRQRQHQDPLLVGALRASPSSCPP